MDYNSIIIGLAAGILTFLFAESLTPLIVTNALLGVLAGQGVTKNKK